MHALSGMSSDESHCGGSAQWEQTTEQADGGDPEDAQNYFAHCLPLENFFCISVFQMSVSLYTRLYTSQVAILSHISAQTT